MDRQEQLDYLRRTYGGCENQLDPIRQVELAAIKSEIDRPDTWFYLALGEAKEEDWNRFGFGLMRKKDFQERVDKKLGAIEKKLDELEIGKCPYPVHYYEMTKEQFFRTYKTDIHKWVKNSEGYLGRQAGMGFEKVKILDPKTIISDQVLRECGLLYD